MSCQGLRSVSEGSAARQSAKQHYQPTYQTALCLINQPIRQHHILSTNLSDGTIPYQSTYQTAPYFINQPTKQPTNIMFYQQTNHRAPRLRIKASSHLQHNAAQIWMFNVLAASCWLATVSKHQHSFLCFFVSIYHLSPLVHVFEVESS